MQHELGRSEADEAMRMMYERRKDKANLSHLHTLAALALEKGRYAESEKAGTEVLVWLEEKLGKDSPQALGSRRIIAQALWKQGTSRRAEAEQVIDEFDDILAHIKSGRFATYQHEERELFEKMLEDLKGNKS